MVGKYKLERDQLFDSVSELEDTLQLKIEAEKEHENEIELLQQKSVERKSKIEGSKRYVQTKRSRSD